MAASQDLEIWLGRKREKVDSREENGRVYYSLRDLTAILRLSFREVGNQFRLQGRRGELQLTDGRPLVRFGEEYILISQPVWRRREKDWYVSEDFLTKALPLILDQKLEKQGPHSYRTAALAENQVQVEVANYPDHVRIAFLPSLDAPVHVREFQDYIEIDFGESVIVPRIPPTPPDQRVVSSMEFDPTGYGVFRIHKGRSFYNFRDYDLDHPQRKVLDLYFPPTVASGPAQEEPTPSPVAEPAPSAGSDRVAHPSQSPAEDSSRQTEVVTIDPGHGGNDYGVHSTQEILEKNLTLKMSERIEEKLKETGLRTVLTRSGDVDLLPEYRSSIGNYFGSRLFVSIHSGGSPAAEMHGPIVYVYRYPPPPEPPETEATSNVPDQAAASVEPVEESAAPVSTDANAGLTLWEDGQRPYLAQSRDLAERLQEALNQVYGTQNKVVEAPLTVLAPVTAPAIVVEIGFLTNPEDQEKLGSDEFQEKLSATVADTLLKYLGH